MVFICTGIEKLDELLKHKLKENGIESEIIFYADYLLEEKNKELYNTVILAPREDIKLPFKDFLFALRQKDKRIILLAGEKESNKHLGYALALGIYDIVFDPVTPEKVVNAVKNPAKFSDVQKYFLCLKEKVSFSGETVKEPAAASAAESDRTKEEAALNQIKGIMKLLGQKITKDDINEALVELEEAVIRLLF
jgi:DNA-binding response OmpR family regulator